MQNDNAERKTPRTIIIGLDGATFDLILPWSEAEYLPTLTRLMRNGAYGVLDSFPNMNSAAAWSSIVTGTNAGKHGIFDFGEQLNPSRPWHPVTALDRHRNPFWRILTTAGKRVGVMNVPISYPADAVNGFAVSGMDAPSISSEGFAFPINFLEQLRHAGIDYILDVNQLDAVHEREPNHIPTVVRAMVEARTRAFLYGMEQFRCDVGMVVFIATDRMQHYYWGTSENPFDESWTALRELYQLLDGRIAEILARVGEETNVLIVSDHGFGPRRKAKNEVVVILEKTGLMALQHASTNDTLLKHGLAT